MIAYFVRNHGRLLSAFLEHLELVGISLLFSLVLACALTILCMHSKLAAKVFVNLFSVLYAVPSLAMLVILIPWTGLGRNTAVIVLVIYNQYILLRNFITGLNEVDPTIVDAATGMGMTKMQVLFMVRLPLAKKALYAGVRLSLISAIGIATIAALINAGGLGTILLDGLRTMNVNKILWGSLLSAGLAISANALLSLIEKKL